MRNLKRLKQRFGEKGLSQVVTSLLLIAVGIAGAGIVAGLMSSMGATTSSKDVAIMDKSLVVPTSGSAIASVTVKNVGTSSISTLTITISDNTLGTISNLAPGETKSVSGTLTGTFVAGNTYPIKIAGDISKVDSVLARI